MHAVFGDLGVRRSVCLCRSQPRRSTTSRTETFKRVGSTALRRRCCAALPVAVATWAARRIEAGVLRLVPYRRAVQKLATLNEGTLDKLTIELDRSSAATLAEQMVELGPNSYPTNEDAVSWFRAAYLCSVSHVGSQASLLAREGNYSSHRDDSNSGGFRT